MYLLRFSQVFRISAYQASPLTALLMLCFAFGFGCVAEVDWFRPEVE